MHHQNSDHLTFGNLKAAAKGEVDLVLQKELAAAGHDVALKDLSVEQHRGGTTYRHPETNEPLIELQTIRDRMLSRKGTTPGVQLIGIRNPKGYIVTRVRVETVGPHDSEKGVPCVTEIKNYWPPTEKQKLIYAQRGHGGALQEVFEEKAYVRDKNRKAARDFKNRAGWAPESATHDENLPGEPAAPTNGESKSHAAKPAILGVIRRERAFRVPEWGNIYDISLPKELILPRRMSKDISRHSNGNITAVQYAKNSYTVTQIDSSGKRMGQATYDSYDEAVKEMGAQEHAHRILPAKNRDGTPDHIKLSRQKNRALRQEAQWLSHVRDPETALGSEGIPASASSGVEIKLPAHQPGFAVEELLGKEFYASLDNSPSNGHAK